MTIEKEYYSLLELSQMFGLNKLTVYRMVKEGKIKAFKFGGSFRVSKEALQDYIKNHETVVGWDDGSNIA